MGEAFKYMSPGTFDFAGGKQYPMSSPDPSDSLDFLALRRPDSLQSGEQRLCYAVLIDGLACAVSARPQQCRYERQEAREWIASNDESWPFSFTAICSYLHIEPSTIRAAIAKLDLQGRRKSIHRPHLAGSGQHTINGDVIVNKRGRPRSLYYTSK